jgi:FMN phosphatase YigB (HAD superfamily)
VSQTVQLAKPDEKIWALMFDRARSRDATLEKHELVFVDDKQENVDAAVAFGCCGVTFDNTKHGAEQLREALRELGFGL